MGCDIHPRIQYRHPGGDYWRDFSGEMSWDRWYSLFELMAGVRCDGETPCTDERCARAIAQPRGWPDGRRPYEMDDDLHTPSWLTLAELREVRALLAAPAIDVDATIAAMATLEAGGLETRLVFAFDN